MHPPVRFRSNEVGRGANDNNHTNTVRRLVLFVSLVHSYIGIITPMLGKGLESLIPPNKNKFGSGQAPNQESNQDDIGSEQAPQDVPQAAPGGSGLGTEDDGLREASSSVNPFSSAPPLPNEEDAGFVNPIARVPREDASKQISQKYDAVFHIEVEKITPNPHQPRRNFDEESIRELAASIREFGILQPLVVTKIEREVATGTAVEYQLIAGERRLLAAKYLGLELVPAIIRSIDLERERLELAIVENLQREDLNPIEAARAFARLQEEFRFTQREIAVRIGKSRETIANTLRLLDLPQMIQEALEKRQITETHGRLLLSIDEPGVQERFFQDLLGNKITTRELKNRVRGIRAKESVSDQAPRALPPELQMLQEKLSADLGAPVKISTSGESGKIMISFFSKEELENIVNKLGSDGET